jgi:sugar lactone lactonase YvrE
MSSVNRWRDVHVLADVRAELGEGPIWDHRSERLVWVDILPGLIHTTEPHTGATATASIENPVGAVALTGDSDFLLAVGGGYAGFDGQNVGAIDVVTTGPGQRMNDGALDPVGRFVAGSITEDRTPSGALFSRDLDGTVTTLFGGVTVSNGLAWSGDGAQLFYVDSALQSIDVMDYDVDSGAVSGRRTWVEIPDETGTPDGLTIDAEGCLWLALWGGASVLRFSPEGRMIGVVELPVSRVTSCAFGGPELDRLYITTAGVGASEGDPPNPLDGALFVVEPGCTGVHSVVAEAPS